MPPPPPPPPPPRPASRTAPARPLWARIGIGAVGAALLWTSGSSMWRTYSRHRCADAYDESIAEWRAASRAGSRCAAEALLSDTWLGPVETSAEALRRADRYRGACVGSADVDMLGAAIEASTRAREACRE